MNIYFMETNYLSGNFMDSFSSEGQQAHWYLLRCGQKMKYS